MSFERHAFISYAHIDNQPLPTEKVGWVTLFHEALQQLLAGRLGGNADIWRDHKLRGNDVFSDEIIEQLAKTAVFISVLSPRYLNSEWCTKEIDHFCTVAQQTGGVVVDDNKCRVFKILKLPIERQDALPPVLSQMLGYEFYELDLDRTPRELDPAYGEKSKQEFLRKVAKLAWDMKMLLERLDCPRLGRASPAERRPMETDRVSCRMQPRPSPGPRNHRGGTQTPWLHRAAGQATAARRERLYRGSGDVAEPMPVLDPHDRQQLRPRSRRSKPEIDRGAAERDRREAQP